MARPTDFRLIGWSRDFLNDTLNNEPGTTYAVMSSDNLEPIASSTYFRQTNPTRYLYGAIMSKPSTSESWAQYYTSATVTGATLNVTREKLDLSNYDVKIYFAQTAIPTSGVWSLQDVNAVETDLFIITTDTVNNKIHIKLNPNVDTLDKWENKIVLMADDTKARLVLGYTEKGQTQINVTNNDNSTGFTNKTLLPSTCNVNTSYTVSMSAISGYNVTTTPHITITDGATTLLDTDLTLSDGVYSASITFDGTHTNVTATYTGTAVSVPKVSTTTTNNITGLTLSGSVPSQADINTQYTLRVDIPEDTSVTTVPHILITDGNDIIKVDRDFSKLHDDILDVDYYRYIVTFDGSYLTANITLTGAGSSTIIPVTTVDNMQGFINKNFPTQLIRSTPTTATIELPANFSVTSTAYLRIYNAVTGSILDQVNFSRDGLTSTYKATFGISSQSVTSVRIEYFGVAEDNRRYFPNVVIHDETVHFTDIPTTITLQETVTTSITIHNADGYPYTITAPYVAFKVEDDLYYYDGIKTGVGTWVINITPPKMAGTIPNTSDIYFRGEASEETELAGTNPFVNTFKINLATLADLMAIRFAKVADTGQVTDYLDTTNYFIELYKPYLPVTANADSSSIFVGWIDTELTAPLVKFAYSEVSFSFDVNEVYNNSLDYKSDITLYIPFHGMKNIPANVVMNRTLTGTYRIDNVTGEGVCYLYADGALFDSVKVKAKYETTIQEVEKENVKDIVKAIDDSNEYKDLSPKLFISRPVPLSTNYNTFNNADERTTLTEKGTGKYSIDYIDLQTLATERESTEIKRILSDSIIIL